MINVLVVDDHPAIRVGLKAVFDTDPDVTIVGEAATLSEVRDASAVSSLDVVILDVRLADGDGLDLVSEMSGSAVGFVVYSQYTNDRTVLRALGVGAKGYVVKESEPGVLRSAVSHAAAGRVWIDPRIADKVVCAATKRSRAKPPFGLTPQEWAVVELVPRGLTNHGIAAVLGLSSETIKTHIRNALPKLKAVDRSSAIAILRDSGLI